MVDLTLQKIDLDVEGHIRLQCGTEQHIKPRFNLILPSNIDLENDLKRINDWQFQQMEKERTGRLEARPLVELTGVRIVAYLYGRDITGREMANVQTDRPGRMAMRSVTLYDQAANSSDPLRLD